MIKEKMTVDQEIRELNVKSLFQTLGKNQIRLDIFLLLKLYKKLNVSQISRYLNRSKATVGRHLKSMEKKGILISKEKKTNRNINPLLYSIHPIINAGLEFANDPNKFLSSSDSEKSLTYYKNSFNVIKAVVKFIEHAFNLINPFMDYLEDKLEEDSLDHDVLNKYLTLHKQLSFRHFVIRESEVEDFWKLYMEFFEKLQNLTEESESDEEKSLIFIDALLPLKALLENAGDND